MPLLVSTGVYIAHLFGVARCTVCVIVREICQAIVKVLLPIYICFPTGNRLTETVQGFRDSRQLSLSAFCNDWVYYVCAVY